MGAAQSEEASRSRLGALIDIARREPGKVLVLLLALHLVVWTALPLLVCPNLQLDLAEDLALGREWQLGYWKHPPLPWWIADALYRLTGSIDSVYLLGPLAAVVCFYGVWLLARDTVGGFRGSIGVPGIPVGPRKRRNPGAHRKAAEGGVPAGSAIRHHGSCGAGVQAAYPRSRPPGGSHRRLAGGAAGPDLEPLRSSGAPS